MSQQNPRCAGTPYKTTCGGQALIEGIMMQGPEQRAVVVRKPDGTLDITTTPVKKRRGLAALPFIRGIFVFCSSMVNGVKALMHSAEVSDDGTGEEEELTGLDKWIADHFPEEKAASLIITLAAVVGVAFSIGLFILLPTAVTGLIGLFWTGMSLSLLLRPCERPVPWWHSTR